MKKYTLLLICLFYGFFCRAQLTSGLVAHWNMDSTTNDVSGGGHNGTGSNLTMAVGRDGIMGHGYYFNGVNSYISVPYSSAFNVSSYSISATVQPTGFYMGTCGDNTILIRGKTGLGNCVYTLHFNSEPAGFTCSSFDITQETFWSGSSAPGVTLSPPMSSYNYTPYIVANQWYNVVVTFNDTCYKTYVNGILKATAYITNPGVPMGTGTDSISIGYDLVEAPGGYPYPFKGVIDDIRLYNRVLDSSEVRQLMDTCGRITAQPVAFHVTSGATAMYTVATTISTPVYQWQQDAGVGFVNLSNSGPYSGVNTDTLKLTGVTPAMNSYHYRCIVSNSAGCSDTSSAALLAVGMPSVLFNDFITVSPNPAKNRVTVKIPENFQDGKASLINEVGQTMLETEFFQHSAQFQIDALLSGVYFIKVSSQGQSVYKKLIKY